MAAYSRRCPDCGRSWKQRDARFCGSCGALLAPLEAVRSPRRPPAVLRRAAGFVLGAVAAGVLVVAVTNLDLAVDGGEMADPGVRIDPAPDTQPNPLSPALSQTLRSHADPDRMRCEPRGCDVWRLEIGEIVWHDPYAGVVALADGSVLVSAGPFAEVRERMDGSSGLSRIRGHRIVAIDPTTGERSWSRELIDDDRSARRRATDVRLQPGPHGATLLVHGGVTALTDDGEVVWQRPGRWGMLDGSLALIIEEDERLNRLDPVTGDTLWQVGDERYTEALVVGNRLLATTLGGDQHLIDARSGEVLGVVSGWLLGQPVPAPGGLVGVMFAGRETTGGPAVQPAPLRLAHLAPDGSPTWITDLGTSPDWWDCCVVDARAGTVSLRLSNERRTYDLATGALLDAESVPAALDPRDISTLQQPQPDGVETIWSDDGHQVTMRSTDGEVTVAGQRQLSLVSLDPLIFSDGQDLLHVRPVG